MSDSKIDKCLIKKYNKKRIFYWFSIETIYFFKENKYINRNRFGNYIDLIQQKKTTKIIHKQQFCFDIDFTPSVNLIFISN